MTSDMGSARLIVQPPDGAEEEVILQKDTSLGRLFENDIVLNDQSASRRHAVIRTREDGVHMLADLGSGNGTIMNDYRVELPTPLADGDTFEIAGYRFLYRCDRQPIEDPTLSGTDERTLVYDLNDRPQLIGASPAMVEVFELIQLVAASPIPVLIEGETGTGKELVARAIHRTSSRSKAPFIPVNCAAISENILESELFGHRKGAFTGASQDRIGLFEAASGGCIFLDEVGEMPLNMQPKLLRVLQEGEVTPVGDTRARPVDVRVISATNRDLAAQALEGSFRSDLYYRLSAFPVRLPPLRDRHGDVALIAERLLSAAALRHNKKLKGIEPDALELLSRFPWPGNVRELRNELERAVAVAHNCEKVRTAHLSERIREARLDPGADASAEDTDPSGEVTATATPRGRLQNARAAFETRYIAQVLEEQGGNVTRAAHVLGLSRSALHKKIKTYGLGGDS